MIKNRELEILRHRARLLAEQPEDDARSSDASTVVVACSNQKVGIPLRSLREIAPKAPITPVPGVRPWLLGVAELHGELLSVLDISRLWDQPGTVTGRYFAVVSGGLGEIALLVDAVTDVRALSSQDLCTDLAESFAAHRAGVFAMTRDLVHILDVDKLLLSPLLVVDQTPDGSEAK